MSGIFTSRPKIVALNRKASYVFPAKTKTAMIRFKKHVDDSKLNINEVGLWYWSKHKELTWVELYIVPSSKHIGIYTGPESFYKRLAEEQEVVKITLKEAIHIVTNGVFEHQEF